MKDLHGGVRKLAQDWKEGPGQIRVMADQLEDMVDIVSDQLEKMVDNMEKLCGWMEVGDKK